MAQNIVSTPTHERCVTSYAARTQYKPGVVHPPHIKVKDAIDIHCHTHEGQQDPYDLARRASLAEMKGLLFKSIPGDDPVQATQAVQDDVNRWAEKQEGVTPITCWSGYVCGRQMAPVSAKIVSEMIDRGVSRNLAAGIHPRDHHEHRRHLRPFRPRPRKRRLGWPHRLGRSDEDRPLRSRR